MKIVPYERSLLFINEVAAILSTTNHPRAFQVTAPVSFQSADSLDDLHRRNLDWLKTMTEGGSELASAAALHYCARHKISAPTWVIDTASTGYCKALDGKALKKRGRSTGPVERYRQDMIVFARCDEVVTIREKQKEIAEACRKVRSFGKLPRHHLIEQEKLSKWIGHTWLRAYECASMLLQGTPAFGGTDAIKASYLRVKKSSKAGTLRYHIFDSRFLQSVGIQPPQFWNRGNKGVPLYNLTL